MRFAGTRGSAAAVAPRFAAYEQHEVARLGTGAHYVVCGRGSHDEARFQALRLVAVVVHLVHHARRQTYLVAV